MADEKAKVHTHDVALVRAAATGEGLVEITPEMVKAIGERVEAEQKKLESIEETVAAVPYEQRLSVACWVIKHIVAHAQEGGTYRYLIYERLGFGPDAYAPLQMAGALEVSNCFDLTPVDIAADARLAQAIHDAFDPLPVGEQRNALVAAHYRLLELARQAQLAGDRMARRERELKDALDDVLFGFTGSQPPPEPTPRAD